MMQATMTINAALSAALGGSGAGRTAGASGSSAPMGIGGASGGSLGVLGESFADTEATATKADAKTLRTTVARREYCAGSAYTGAAVENLLPASAGGWKQLLLFAGRTVTCGDSAG